MQKDDQKQKEFFIIAGFTGNIIIKGFTSVDEAYRYLLSKDYSILQDKKSHMKHEKYGKAEIVDKERLTEKLTEIFFRSINESDDDAISTWDAHVKTRETYLPSAVVNVTQEVTLQKKYLADFDVTSLETFEELEEE